MTRDPNAEGPRRLRPFAKAVYGFGDHSVNLSLSALSMFFFFFLTEVAGLRPALAGGAIWLARLFDAISDPWIGRFSDTRRWSVGRRRPFFLIGMLPFALAFGLLWRVPFDPEAGQGALFAYYTLVYMALSLATTTLSVPYLALLPEMARDYDDRTSLNAYRSAFAVMGTLFAVGFRYTADEWGGDAEGYATAALVFAVWLLVPWLPAFRVSFERADVTPRVAPPILEGLREVAAHKNFVRLCGLFIAARIAVDVSAAALSYYTAYWLGRPDDLVLMMLVLLCSSVASLPIWLRIGKNHDKHRLFILGAGWWAVLIGGLFFIQPEFPRGVLIGLIALAGFGYCAADLIPWAMIGEVIDEDELTTGQRREGVYNGFFTFMRKIAGASGVALMGVVFEAVGYVPDQPQGEGALVAIRAATALAPAFFLLVAISLAVGYPLTRAEHARIRAELDAR